MGNRRTRYYNNVREIDVREREKERKEKQSYFLLHNRPGIFDFIPLQKKIVSVFFTLEQGSSSNPILATVRWTEDKDYYSNQKLSIIPNFETNFSSSFEEN